MVSTSPWKRARRGVVVTPPAATLSCLPAPGPEPVDATLLRSGSVVTPLGGTSADPGRALPPVPYPSNRIGQRGDHRATDARVRLLFWGWWRPPAAPAAEGGARRRSRCSPPALPEGRARPLAPSPARVVAHCFVNWRADPNRQTTSVVVFVPASVSGGTSTATSRAARPLRAPPSGRALRLSMPSPTSSATTPAP